MVSIRYFCGVGEFCSVKSRPRGTLTSKTGAVRAVATNRRLKTQVPRTKVFNNSGFPHPEIARESPWHPLHEYFFHTARPTHIVIHVSRVDSRSTSLGGISIFCARIGRFAPIR